MSQNVSLGALNLVVLAVLTVSFYALVKRHHGTALVATWRPDIYCIAVCGAYYIFIKVFSTLLLSAAGVAMKERDNAGRLKGPIDCH